MKFFIVLALVAAVAVAVPVDPSAVATVLRYENDNIGVEGYNYAFETSDGKQAQESGVLKNVGTEGEALEVRGSYAYTGEDNKVYQVSYVANENGFQPVGDHLPKA